MREILFRGKYAQTQEWVHGYFFVNEDYPIDEKFPGVIMKPGTADCYPVALNTVGEYASATGKNGVRIFEGDIVKWEHGIVSAVQVSFCGRWVLKYRDTVYTELYGIDANKLEVVGNVHDNPELLTG